MASFATDICCRRVSEYQILWYIKKRVDKRQHYLVHKETRYGIKKKE